MTVAEAINRACDEAEKFDEACRIARQQEEAINELCAWTDELKDYRETGLTPEEVTALQASNQELKKEALPILQAKVQGRLAELPCRLGGTVYANFALRGDYLREKDKPYPCEVVFIGLSKEPFLHIQFMALPGSEKLAAEAKFTKTMSAAEFAEAMVKNAKTQGATYLAQVQKDAQDSGVNGVTNTPPTDKTEGDAFIAAIKGVAPKN